MKSIQITESQLNNLVKEILSEDVNPKLAKIAMGKLYDDIKDAEVIPYRSSVWIIDRKNKYWYIEYRDGGAMYWRRDFFQDFFNIFSMKDKDFEPLLVTMMEDILNNYKDILKNIEKPEYTSVEDDLRKNNGDTFISPASLGYNTGYEDIPNQKVTSSDPSYNRKTHTVGSILKNNTTSPKTDVEDVLKHKVKTSMAGFLTSTTPFDKALKSTEQ
jgi:hypothetical protein